jgi:hypothetical protein
MPSKSKTQQRTMGAALAVKKGDLKLSDIKNKKFKEKVEEIAGDMTNKELEKFASTKHKGLPEKKKKNKEDKKNTVKETYHIGINGNKLFLSEHKINQIIDKYSYGSINKRQLIQKIEKSKKVQ